MPILKFDFYIAALPILLLSVGAVLAMLQSVYPPLCSSAKVAQTVFAFLAAAFIASIWNFCLPPDTFLSGSFVSENLSRYGQSLILAIALSVGTLSLGHFQRAKFFRGEIASLFLMSIVGMLLMVSCDELITLFIGLELSSIGLYALVGYVDVNRKSQEGAIKYFILGSFAAAFLLFGFALFYASCGSLRISEMIVILPKMIDGIWVQVGAVFVLLGLGFKLALAPFHMWAPDAYEGAPTAITALMATCVKVMMIIVSLRFFSQGLGGIYHSWATGLAFLAAASMIVGNVMALVQSSVKRMLAYSSIAHSGYMAVALCALGSTSGSLPIEAVLFYVTAYSVVSIGVFAALMSLENATVNNIQLEDLAGLAKRSPLVSLALTVFMFSFAGMPPTVGFITKFFVFSAAIHSQFYSIVLIGVLASTISLFYYLRIIVKMYMTQSAKSAPVLRSSPSLVTKFILVTSLAFTLLFGTLFPSSMMQWMKSTATPSVSR